MEMNQEPFDNEIKQAIQTEGLDKPSVDFTSQVMDKIKKEQPYSIQLEPLFSRKQWLMLFGSLLACITLSYFTNTELPGQIGHWLSQGFISLSVSKTFVYGLLSFTVLLFVQIYFIKSKVDQIYNS